MGSLTPLLSLPSSLLLGSYLVLALWAASGIDESFILFAWLPLNCTEAQLVWGGNHAPPPQYHKSKWTVIQPVSDSLPISCVGFFKLETQAHVGRAPL